MEWAPVIGLAIFITGLALVVLEASRHGRR